MHGNEAIESKSPCSVRSYSCASKGGERKEKERGGKREGRKEGREERSKRCRSSRHAACGLQLESRSKVGSLDAYKRSYLGCVHHIWSKLPQDVLRIGEESGWSKITKRCKLHLMSHG